MNPAWLVLITTQKNLEASVVLLFGITVLIVDAKSRRVLRKPKIYVNWEYDNIILMKDIKYGGALENFKVAFDDTKSSTSMCHLAIDASATNGYTLEVLSKLSNLGHVTLFTGYEIKDHGDPKRFKGPFDIDFVDATEVAPIPEALLEQFSSPYNSQLAAYLYKAAMRLSFKKSLSAVGGPFGRESWMERRESESKLLIECRENFRVHFPKNGGQLVIDVKYLKGWGKDMSRFGKKIIGDEYFGEFSASKVSTKAE